jgi:Helix-turn-helix domain
MTAIATIPHIRIENSIIDDYLPLIGPFGYTIYSVIKRHLNQKNGDCYPSYKTIARKSGIDRGTVIRYVKKLTALNLISPLLRFKEDGSHTSNQYDFQTTGISVPSKIQGTQINVPQEEIDKSIQIVQGGGSEPPPLVAENNHSGCTEPPKQSSSSNKKIRTITEVDLLPTEKQKTCSHPPELIVILPENITICNHCYGLLDENFRLIEEEKLPVEIVAA